MKDFFSIGISYGVEQKAVLNEQGIRLCGQTLRRCEICSARARQASAMGSFAGDVAKDMDKGMQYSRMAWCKNRKTVSKLSRYLIRYENTGSWLHGFLQA